MKKNIRNLFFCCNDLLHPDTFFLKSCICCLGLELWYEKMVPVLLPFMILSGTLIRMGLVNSLIRPVYPLFEKIFRLSRPGIYVILMGFLCGFPMGARTIADFATDRNFL